MNNLLTFLTFTSLFWASSTYAVCSSNLVVDNYAKFSTNLNTLGQWTSDDGTTTNLKGDTANKKITFTASASSYFYTTLNCVAATTNQYNAITFPVKGPAGSQFIMELQSSTSCSVAALKSYFTSVTGITGVTQTITVPLSAFTGANLNAIKAFVFESFSKTGAWEIGQTQLVCANVKSVTSGPTSSPSSQLPTSSVVVPASTNTLSTSTQSPSSLPVSSTSATSTSSSASSVSSVVVANSASTSSTSSTLVSSSTTLRPSTSSTLVTSSSTLSTAVSSTSSPAGQCTDLLIDDFSSQSRLTFLYYNALLKPSSDDGTMKPVTNRADTSTSVIVADNTLTLTPADKSSYWYTATGCLKTTNIYGGIGMNIKAVKGTTLTIEIQTSTACTTDNPLYNDVTSADLGWVFDGTAKYYTIPFAKFPGLDKDHIVAVLFTALSKPVTFGPIAAYCGNTGTAYPLPVTAVAVAPTATVPATVGPTAFVIDAFTNADSNALGFYHGGDDPATYKIASGKLTIKSGANADLSWYTQVSDGCRDLSSTDNGYLHIAYTGSSAFTIALQQHNPTCNPNLSPFPQTWDSIEAARYSNSAKTDIYVPISHFQIDRTKSIGFALKGFYTSNPSVLSKIEIVKTVPNGFLVPSKLPSAPLVFSCTRPNSFAFAIDDGDPIYAPQVVKTIAAAGIKVTFFTVGAALLDTGNNLAVIYKDMINKGHQIAYHSYSHPPMEGLATTEGIDWEITSDITAVSSTLGITSKYFRPPFGTEGARVRQRLAAQIPGSKFIAWSVDVQDYIWALSTTPGEQVTAFQSDVDKGGNLVVMHYLYNSTVQYLPEFIRIAKATGKQLMRVDQCLEDPDAPPL